MMISTLLACLAPCLPQDPAPSTGAEESRRPAPIERIAVIGASASAGFGLEPELGTSLPLAEFMKLALAGTGAKLSGFAETAMFLQPEKNGKQQVAKALESDPTLLIAIDFAFWYGYGELRGCESRLSLLEHGLEELDRFSCPILLGDLPDMTRALKGHSALMGGGAMLSPTQIPKADCLKQLNQRIKQWAAQKPNVRIFPLNFFMGELAKDSTLEFGPVRFDAQSKQRMLQADLLHPKAYGTVAATLFILHQLVQEGWLEANSVAWDPLAFEKKIYASTQAVRDAAAQKRRDRARKKKEREAKRAKREGGGKRELSLMFP